MRSSVANLIYGPWTTNFFLILLRIHAITNLILILYTINIYHTEIIFQKVHKLFSNHLVWLHINTADLFNDVFPICKVRWWETSFRVTKKYLVHCWASKLASVKKKQKAQCSAARERAWQYDEWKEETTKHRAEK